MRAGLSGDKEIGRMAALSRYDILDTPPDGNFDAITALAARLLKVPIALTTLVDTDRIWFKSRVGVDIEQIDRVPGLCASVILTEGPYVVRDAATDPRTLANPLVAGEFGLRFYAAVPLRTHDGFNLGTLCVLDHEPREIGDHDLAILKTLAGLVMDQMELRIASRSIAERSHELAASNAELVQLHEVKDRLVATAAHDLRNPLGTVVMMAKLLQEEKFGPLNERQRQMIEAVCEASDVMTRLVNDHLNLSALAGGKTPGSSGE